ncbi:thioredoxin-like protein 4B-like isoform X1 [Hibiscus syriacus]|uniref:Thioredoxin-like protein 4B-like isoform X1 n=1 Tax=Hibiscus syriacus TaxID=106335 RepID=A0A6A2WTZ0_HIBSY|nr:thioredoxin-like protein 4B-like isoform X1 [Hibiscus syriacus]
MIREAPITFDQLVQQEYASVPPCARKNVHNNNISVQTGEEFAMEFLKECVGARGIPAIPDAAQIYETRVGINQNQNQQLVYEDLAQILGLKRMDSECVSDISDVASVQGSCRGSENGSCVEKLSKYQKENDDMGQVERKVFGELSCDRSDLNVFAPATTPTYACDFPRSSNLSGQGASDGSQSEKMKLLCSFGGKILPRPSDGKLRYVGGETRIITFQKCLSWDELVRKTLDAFNQPHAIKYQLPGEDLDALISVSSDEDLQNMIEEYNGLEKLVGSQRLRVFLIPSLVASTIQQNNPDYHYMAAVNGVVDHSSKKNSGGPCLPSEGNQLGPALDHNPSFRKRCPTSVLPLETIGCLNAFHPSQVFHDSQYTTRSPFVSPPISPQPFQRGDSKSVCAQAVGGKSINESNSSFITAQLNPESCGIENPNYKQVQQLPPALMNYNHPYVNVDASQAFQAHKVQLKIQNSDPGKNPVSLSVLTKNNSVCYSVSHERPISLAADPLSLLASSVDPIDSHPGMIHAFSDTKLLELGGRSDYCSQEGTSPFPPSNFATTRSPSNLVQEMLMQQEDNIGLLKSWAQNDLLDSDPTSESTLELLIFSPNHEASCRNKTILKGAGDSNDKCQTAKINLSKTIVTTPNNYDEYATSLDASNRSGKVDPVLHQGGKLYEWRSPDSNMVYNDKLSNADCNQTFGAVIDTWKEDSQGSQLSSLDIMDNIDHPQTMEKTTYGTIECCDFSGKVTSGQGSITSCTDNPKVTCIFPKTMENLSCESSVGDLISVSLNGPMLLEPQQVECVASQKDISKEDMLTSTAILHLSAVHVDSGLCSNLHKNDLHSMLQNPEKDASYRREVSLIDDDLNYPNQNAGKMVATGSVHENAIVVEFIFGQTETSSVNRYQIQPDPLVNLDDVITSVPSGFEVSSAIVPPADVTDKDIVSPIATELVDIILEPESKAAAADDQDKDDPFSDAKIAEMEASIYGLQIIKDADLEDLRELGSGTYGTVYHGKWRGTDVAIKRIKKSCLSGRSSEKDRQIQDFWREAQILSNLHHPNVVAFYGVVPDGSGGTLATVTEYMVNGSLRNVLIKKERSLDLHKRLIIAMGAAFGMEYLHSKNIVHFDLKCDNLLVNLRDPQRPICKIGDFGLSRIKRNTLVSGSVRGTLPWMAPELLNGSSTKVSEKVDVFSFGISMWEILTGEEPYADMHCGAIIGGIVKNTLRPAIPECCHPDWRKLMEQCWSPDPESRPSFTEITKRLRSMSMLLKPKGGTPVKLNFSEHMHK